MTTDDILTASYRNCDPGNLCPRSDEKIFLKWDQNKSVETDILLPSNSAAPSVDGKTLFKNNVSDSLPVVSSSRNVSDEYVIFFSYNTNGVANWNVSHSNNTSANVGNVTGSGEEIGLSNGVEVTLIVFYTLTILFSIIGNILVVIVFTRGRRCRTDIRPFLINLAAADLIMALFCMPFTFTYVMTRTWIFSEPMCPLVLFMQHLSVGASVFTNMAIGIDRFLVVTFPLKARMTSRRARYTICVIWTCAVALSSVQLVVGRAREMSGVVSCDEVWNSQSSRRTFTMLILFITYIVPLVILSVTYSIVSRLLWKRTAPGNAHEGRDLQQLRAKRKVIKMLVLVVIMFGVCWLPLHTFFLVLDFKPELIQANSLLSTVVFYIAFLLAMSNSCANPIIYGFTNDSFRMDLASLCTLWFPFCVCLKRLANRKFSVSTYDSQYNRRFSTLRKGPIDSIYRQTGGTGSSTRSPGGDYNCDASGCRDRSKMYIELRRGLLTRNRSALSMNDFYRDSLERGAGKRGVRFSSNGDICSMNNNHHTQQKNKVVDRGRGDCRTGIIKNSQSNISIFRDQSRPLKQVHHSVNHTTRPARRLPTFVRSQSGDSTKRLTPNRSHESDLGELQFTAQFPGNGSDVMRRESNGHGNPCDSPSSVALSEFSFPRPTSNGSPSKLKCLPENDCSQFECDDL
ncbi:neuromedin-K receptor [Elysia marginata]|uniref:Neuromedin-K receptor n=1 Tax=Elysia marginata TaxID=1093978 RepID=A0AAV4I430_9GAST|nr:neuromedin-K receptor [Elysia marginata]